jgi:SHS2 domain-containing protein
MRYEQLEHTADAMVKAHGKDLSERFENAAYAMFDQMTDACTVEPKGEVKVVLEADSREGLLVDFLQELLFLHDVRNLVFSEFEVRTDGKTLEALARGEEFDSRKHPKKALVKAVTYHGLEFNDQEGSVTILFDV